jgi:hypothetical protein
MKTLLAAGVAALALCSAACTSTGALAPAAQSDITQALAIACPVESAVHAQVAAQNSADVTAADTLLVSLCPPNPAPTNAVVAALDILNAYEVLKPLAK